MPLNRSTIRSKVVALGLEESLGVGAEPGEPALGCQPGVAALLDVASRDARKRHSRESVPGAQVRVGLGRVVLLGGRVAEDHHPEVGGSSASLRRARSMVPRLENSSVPLATIVADWALVGRLQCAVHLGTTALRQGTS